MKAGWEIKTLGEVCDFENGDRGENYPSKAIQTTTGIPFINAGHLTDDGIGFEKMSYIPRERFNLLGNGKIRKNDILFCLRGSLGKFASVGELSEGAIASSLVIVRPKEFVLNEFVLAYFQSDLCAKMIDDFRNGAAQPNLSAGSLKNFTIPLPPLPEQKRLVTLLDEAFESIATAKANAEQNLKNARALFESHLNEVFTQRGEGWENKPFEDVLEIKNGRDQKAVQKEHGQYPIYGSAGNVMGWTDNYICEAGTTIVGRKGTINKPIYIQTKFWNVDTAFGLSPKKILNSKFLHYFCLSYDFSKHNRGTTIPSLVKSDLLQIQIPIPPTIEIQEKLVNKFSLLHQETQRLEDLYSRKIAALDELKKALLHRAFAGEL